MAGTRAGNFCGTPDVEVAEPALSDDESNNEADYEGDGRRGGRGPGELAGSVPAGFSSQWLAFPGRAVYTVVVNSGVLGCIRRIKRYDSVFYMRVQIVF